MKSDKIQFHFSPPIRCSYKKKENLNKIFTLQSHESIRWNVLKRYWQSVRLVAIEPSISLNAHGVHAHCFDAPYAVNSRSEEIKCSRRSSSGRSNWTSLWGSTSTYHRKRWRWSLQVSSWWTFLNVTCLILWRCRRTTTISSSDNQDSNWLKKRNFLTLIFLFLLFFSFSLFFFPFLSFLDVFLAYDEHQIKKKKNIKY